MTPQIDKPSWREQAVDPKTGGFARPFAKLFQQMFDLLMGGGIIPGTDPTGLRDSSTGFNAAIRSLQAAGGGVLLVPAGVYKIAAPVIFQQGLKNLVLTGVGPATLFLRSGEMPDGQGMFDIQGSTNLEFRDFSVDGAVTVPVGVSYTTVAGNPMLPLLTKNTSFWVHGGSKKIYWKRVTITHTGGYARLIDPFSGLIEDVGISECTHENNRPHLFGTNPADLTFGSWTGGTYVNGDGTDPAEHRVLRRFRVTGNTFRRCAGNQLWTHLFALNELHSMVEWTGNAFEDIGLDGILVGGITGGVVGLNTLRRIGYITQTDTDDYIPKWLPNAQATAIDSSGIVKGVNYVNNSITSVNGGSMDLDGHGLSAITGNVMRCPQPGEPEYDEDKIAISGPTNTLSQMYGINLGNSNDEPLGAEFVNISANQFLYLRAGAVRMFASRRCQCEANSIAQVSDPSVPPIVLGSLGPGPNRRTYQTYVRHNRISYSPAAAAPAIQEVDSAQGFADFDPGDKNFVFGNNPIDGNGNAVEFEKAASSGSTVYATTVWFP